MPYDAAEYPTVARKMQAVLGTDGKNWCKDIRDDGAGRHCLLGALDIVTTGKAGNFFLEGYSGPLHDLLANAIRQVDPGRAYYLPHHPAAVVASWNNNREVGFADITRSLDIMHDMEMSALVGAV